jgi:hypothetical protein
MSITRDQANSAITSPADETDAGKDTTITDGEQTAVELAGRKKFFELRKHWSAAIITWISGLILFNSFLAVSAGAGWLDFSEYQWLITAISVETFLQVVGLGYVAAKYLFSKG